MSDKKAKVVDVHYHVISPDLAKEIAECTPIPCRYDPKDREGSAAKTPGLKVMTEAEQLAMADKLGIDIMWVSPRAPLYFDPGKLLTSSQHCLTVARTINDHFSDMCQRYPERFKAFAEVPLALGDAAIEEMGRALSKLGLHGVCLQSNYDGKPLDVPEFRPFFEEANRLHAVIHVHPMDNIRMEKLFQDSLVRLNFGWTFDTTLTAYRLALSGLLEQLPNITFIWSHGGGTIPFLWPRFTMAIRSRPTTPGQKAPPISYLQRCFYDTAFGDTETLTLTNKRFGDNIMLGTDYPFVNEYVVAQTVKAVEAMDISDETKAKIMGGNALAFIHRP